MQPIGPMPGIRCVYPLKVGLKYINDKSSSMLLPLCAVIEMRDGRELNCATDGHVHGSIQEQE